MQRSFHPYTPELGGAQLSGNDSTAVRVAFRRQLSVGAAIVDGEERWHPLAQKLHSVTAK